MKWLLVNLRPMVILRDYMKIPNEEKDIYNFSINLSATKN